MKYRPEIDGLRALAVVPVVFFHAGFELFSGGFVGVDIFFVISGYLITSILIEDIENNRFSILNFYERRARRILPALFFVMLCCIPFAWMWMLPSQLKDFSQSLVAVSLFASNFLFWLKSDYFAAAAEERPLLHTWSLAVEEQYYVLFPIFLFFAWRCGKNRVFWMIVILAAISLTLSEWGWRNNASANFYLAPARAWELFAGSIASFIVQKRGVKKNDMLALAGLVAIIISIVSYDETTPFPSVYSLVPVLGVVLLVLYGQKETVAAKLLGMRLIVGIGLISYSTYLWHQPLFAFARIRLLTKPSDELMLLLSLISIGLAVLSWKYVEQPFRHRTGLLRTRKSVFSLSILSLFFFSMLGFSGHLSFGFPDRVNETVLAYDSAANDKNPYREKCHLHSGRNEFEHPLKGCRDFFIDGRASVMMIGDSHSDAISFSVQKSLLDHGISTYAVSYSGCIGLPGLYRVDLDASNKCAEYNESMLRYAEEMKVTSIIITSRFPLYLDGDWYSDIKNSDETQDGKPTYVDLASLKSEPLAFESEKRKARVKEQLKMSLHRLLARFNVIVVEPFPEARGNVAQTIARAEFFENETLNLNTSLELYRKRNTVFFDVLDSIQSEKLFRVGSSSVFCNELEDTCSIGDDKGVFYKDDNHLSEYGAELITPSIVDAVSKSEPKKYLVSHSK